METQKQKIIKKTSNLINIKAIIPNNYPLPQKKSQTACCFDLATAVDFSIGPNETLQIPSISCEIPEGYAILVKERSGGVLKHNITVDAGVIDSDYRGNIGIMLYKKPKVGFFETLGHAWRITKEACKNLDKSKLSFYAIERLLSEFFDYKRKRNERVYFKKGERIAQMEVVQVIPAKFVKVNKLSKTKRGTGGFGSTGK